MTTTLEPKNAAHDLALLDRLVHRAFVYTTHMIFEANHRKDKEYGDPKVGGHPASCASANQILGALHLAVRRGYDWVCGKPHVAPLDHSFSYMLGLCRRHDESFMNDSDAEVAMHNLRHFSWTGEPTYQSYHASSDPDHFNFLPSGSVGIPPVNSAYLALAYRFAARRGLKVPTDAHFWSLIGDSEFREGSLMECMPDIAERELGNVTWIIDYNRQNLDGPRLPNDRGLKGTDAMRIKRSSEANGWEVIDCMHGRFRLELFSRPGGAALRRVLEEEFSDYQFTMLLLKQDAAEIRAQIGQRDLNTIRLMESLTDLEVIRMLADLGGNDIAVMIDALERSRSDRRTPTIVIAHTVKGWGLECAASQGNHSAMPNDAEIKKLLESENLDAAHPYRSFAADSEEGRFLARRGAFLRHDIDNQTALRDANRTEYEAAIEAVGGLPETVDAEQLKNVPDAHTQWMWGQLAAKLVRTGTHSALTAAGKETRELSDKERRWAAATRFLLTLSPDVGTSTNINPSMDQKVFAPQTELDLETEWQLKGRGRPILAPHEEAYTSHIRFEIAEANCMSAKGSFGKLGDFLGVPLLPMMTVYDFFIKRALDQLYYNLYWKSSFILVGTPSGVTLSPEGAQHSWKSDIQMPNLITWEPSYAIELDWILADAIRRHFDGDTDGRTGVLIRAVTRGLEQREMLRRLRRHRRVKVGLSADTLLSAAAGDGGVVESEAPSMADDDILAIARADCLEGGYYIVDWRGYVGYRPGDNVVRILAMGAMVTEALAAADRLVEFGIFADVILVTSPELLLGILGEKTGYRHLRAGLGVDGTTHLFPDPRDPRAADLLSFAAGRVPIVAVCDGEAGLLDNAGSIVGVRQETLAVRKFSKCGRPSDIYRYQHLDGESIVDAARQVLAQAACEKIVVHPEGLRELARAAAMPPVDPKDLL